MIRSLSSRLIIFLTLSAGSIIALGLAADYRLSRTEILERLKEDSRKTVADVVHDLESVLRGVEGSTRFLGGILQQQDYSRPGLERMLSDTVAKNEDVFGATIALAPGHIEEPGGFAPYYYERGDSLLRSDLSQGEIPYWDRPWFANAVATGGPVWTEPYFDAGGANVYMTTYAVPVYHTSANGEKDLYGVVTADITLEELHRYLQRLQLGEHGMGFLVSTDGLVLDSRSPSSRMVPYEALLSDARRIEVWRRVIEEAQVGHAPAHRMSCDITDGNCVVRMTRLHYTGWVLGVIYSENEVLAPLREYEYKTLTVGLLSLLAMALVLSVVTRRITRPLSALAHTADAFGEGHFDAALPRVTGSDEVARLVRSFAAMKSQLKRHIADLEQATATRSRMEGELSAAHEIQMSMLPHNGEAHERSEDFELWARVRPARSVGGDLFTYSQIGRRLYFAVGDVSDKGVPAALFMARTMSSLQHLEGGHPGELLAHVNSTLADRNDNCMFVTLFLGNLDLDTLALTFASAGHTPPMLLRQGLISSITQESGPPTGLAPDQQFPDNHLQLQPGDRLAVYTDGIDEAFDNTGEMFGIDRLGRHLESTGDWPLGRVGTGLLEAIDTFAGGTAQSDDITLLLLDLAPNTTALEQQRRFKLEGDVVTRCTSWLHTTLEGATSDDARNDLTLVLEEVVTNIHKYAGLGAGDEVLVDLSLHRGEITLRVRDRGVAFNPLQQSRRAELGADIASAEVGGLGVHLIERLTDWQRYRREQGWNCLELGRNLGDGERDREGCGEGGGGCDELGGET